MSKRKVIRLLLIFAVSFFLISCKKDEAGIKGTITLNYEELSITSDSSSSAVLFATLENLEGNIIWSSSDPSIASVTPDSNPTIARITGLKPGIAIIKALVGDQYAECRINVNQGEFLNVSKTKIELAVGKTEVINAEAHVSNITFTSSNESVATVTSNGLVSALAEGNAIITVKAGTKTAYVAIVVEEPGIEFAEADDIVLKFTTNPSAQISVSSKGGVDISQGVWSIDDDTVATITVNDGLLLVEALETGIGRSTTVRFKLNGFEELTKTITVKDIDLILDLSPLTGTFLAKETAFKMDAVLTPTQEGARADITWSASPSGIIDISPDGTITRNPDYVYTEDEVLITITAKSVIDPEAQKVATILVENPKKGIKYITDLASFNQVMTSSNSDATIYLMADIDLGGKVYSGPIMPGEFFNGYFHGNGHKIYNFTAAGVFGSITGTVENLAVTGTMVGSQRGFLAFHIIETATVRNIFIDVTFKKPSAYVAGLGLLGKASNVIIIARNPDGIFADQVYGGFVQGGTGTDIVLNVSGSISTGGSGISVKTEEQLRSSSTYANFDTNIWYIADGEIPHLLIQNMGE